MYIKTLVIIATACILFTSCTKEKKSFSGIYPHLAMYNEEGECGTGAVVPWADKLWVVTYAPHKPFGSTDKLYEIDNNLNQRIREESIGGTPANRMIHLESMQLNIGPYFINANGDVRALVYNDHPGRYTGTARHLDDPTNKIYIATMEEGFYEVDVNTLTTIELYPDGNPRSTNHKDTDVNPSNDLLLGAHGKGLYSGQGVLVYSNNGEASKEALHKFNITSGSLSEWDGKEWKLIRRNQFVEVTGPGGIYGNSNPSTDPIWATGWDHKSVLVGVRMNGDWSFYRLPKASHSYDGAHGWNTEWPRIRDIGTKEHKDYLMTMHGMFWRFPGSFSPENSVGIRPRSAYLKVIGDYTRWNDRIVFGCDDTAKNEFLNERKVKGGIGGAGQSNSNLWFVTPETIDQLGKTNAAGSIYFDEEIEAGLPSEPMLFAGWEQRCMWINTTANEPVRFNVEVDLNGTNEWTELQSITVEPNSSKHIPFNSNTPGEWIRVRTDKNTNASVVVSYGEKERRGTQPSTLFKGLASINDTNYQGGLLYSLGNDKRMLGVLANNNNGETGYYEVDASMKMTRVENPVKAEFIRTSVAIPKHSVIIDSSSVLIIDDSKRRWRLPITNYQFWDATENGQLRICREVVTERDLFNCMGTFFELPAENADGFAKIRPVSSHNYRINDYASYRGLLVLTGINPSQSKGNEHIIVSNDKKASIWVGSIDDLWKLGKPTGQGGPWYNANVKANIPSDAFLIGFYDQRSVALSHQSATDITFTLEFDPTGDGQWFSYKQFTVKPDQVMEYNFPASVNARWVRVRADKNTTATCWFKYQ
jgi:hypothetical protein